MARMLEHYCRESYERVRIKSAGFIQKTAGNRMSSFAHRELQRRAIPTEGHFARCVFDIDLTLYSNFFIADEALASKLRRFRPEICGKEAVLHAHYGGLSNPYELGMTCHAACAEIIEKEMRELAQHFEKAHSLVE